MIQVDIFTTREPETGVKRMDPTTTIPAHLTWRVTSHIMTIRTTAPAAAAVAIKAERLSVCGPVARYAMGVPTPARRHFSVSMLGCIS